MHFTILFLSLLATGTLALPNAMVSKREIDDSQVYYAGPLATTHECPGPDEHSSIGRQTPIFGAPANVPNWECLSINTATDWIGINLLLSNASALNVYSDGACTNRIAFVTWDATAHKGENQFCVKQSETESATKGGWLSVKYARP